ncbi:MAG: acyltransferase [Rubellimicrobium sp.]|nr:acyltransferase [Rubellimicrobium sp.]
MLRALAAVMVLVGHVLAESAHYAGWPAGFDRLPWTRGVDVFFVISGFIVTLSAARFHGRPGAFLARRILRVVPLYWLFTTLMVAVVVVLPQGAKDTGFEPGQIVASYLFLPWAREDGRIAPVLSLGWTLNYEIFFYALFALALAMRRPLAGAALGIGALVAAGLAFGPTGAAALFWTSPLMLEFLFGMALARLWQAGIVRPDLRLACLAMLLGLAGLVLLHGSGLPRVLAAGIPATVIVAGGTLLCPSRPMPFQLLGDASYALYLSHRFVLRGMTLVLLPLLPAVPLWTSAFVVATSALALVTSVLVWRYVERPMLAVLDMPRRPVAA